MTQLPLPEPANEDLPAGDPLRDTNDLLRRVAAMMAANHALLAAIATKLGIAA